jgi:hypothetical protein
MEDFNGLYQSSLLSRAEMLAHGYQSRGRGNGTSSGFSSFSGFLGHAAMGNLDPLFIGLALVMAAGPVVGSHL